MLIGNGTPVGAHRDHTGSSSARDHACIREMPQRRLCLFRRYSPCPSIPSSAIIAQLNTITICAPDAMLSTVPASPPTARKDGQTGFGAPKLLRGELS